MCSENGKVETRASILSELGLSTVQDPKSLNEPLEPEVAKRFRQIMKDSFEKYWEEDFSGDLD